MSKQVRTIAVSLIASIVAFGTASWAQQTQPAAKQPAAQASTAEAKAPMTLRKLFTRADSNADGKVTKEEAKFVLPITYANFEKIDTEKRGWINFDQFMAFTNKRVDKQADDILTLGDKF